MRVERVVDELLSDGPESALQGLDLLQLIVKSEGFFEIVLLRICYDCHNEQLNRSEGRKTHEGAKLSHCSLDYI